MLSLLVFILAVFGFASAVAVLKVGQFFLGTEKKRKGLGRIPFFGDMFYCPPCLAFWIGMGISLVGLSPSAQVAETGWRAVALDGFLACGAVWLLHAAILWMAGDEVKE